MIFLGDASEEASVICRTLQGSAHIEEDFMERTNTEMYRISFGPGETEKPCEGKHSYIIYCLYFQILLYFHILKTFKIAQPIRLF